MPGVSKGLYQRYLKIFVFPKVKKHHKAYQAFIMDKVIKNSNGELHLAGDAQFDSPGFSASLGHYTFIDLKTRLVVHGEVVHKKEVGKEIYSMRGGRRCSKYQNLIIYFYRRH